MELAQCLNRKDSLSFLFFLFHLTGKQIKWANHFVLSFYWLRWRWAPQSLWRDSKWVCSAPRHPASQQETGRKSGPVTDILPRIGSRAVNGEWTFNEVRVPTEGCPLGFLSLRIWDLKASGTEKLSHSRGPAKCIMYPIKKSSPPLPIALPKRKVLGCEASESKDFVCSSLYYQCLEQHCPREI